MFRIPAFFLATLFFAAPANAQPEVRLFDFGSADTPTETLPSRFGALAARADVYGGPSYIGVEWRTGVGFDAEAAAGPFSLGLGGRLHGLRLLLAAERQIRRRPDPEPLGPLSAVPARPPWPRHPGL